MTSCLRLLLPEPELLLPHTLPAVKDCTLTSFLRHSLSQDGALALHCISDLSLPFCSLSYKTNQITSLYRSHQRSPVLKSRLCLRLLASHIHTLLTQASKPPSMLCIVCLSATQTVTTSPWTLSTPLPFPKHLWHTLFHLYYKLYLPVSPSQRRAGYLWELNTRPCTRQIAGSLSTLSIADLKAEGCY